MSRGPHSLSISSRAVILISLFSLWMILWLLPQYYLRIAIPPYRRGFWTDSPWLAPFADAWAYSLLLIPVPLAFLGITLSVRQWRQSSPLSGAIVLSLLTLLPVGIIATYSFRDFFSALYPTDSAILPGFSWWPGTQPPEMVTHSALGLSNLLWSSLFAVLSLKTSAGCDLPSREPSDTGPHELPRTGGELRASRWLAAWSFLLFLLGAFILFSDLSDFRRTKGLILVVAAAPPFMAVLLIALLRNPSRSIG